MGPNEPGRRLFSGRRDENAAPAPLLPDLEGADQAGATAAGCRPSPVAPTSTGHTALEQTQHGPQNVPHTQVPRPYTDRSLSQATKDKGETRRNRPPVTVNAAYARADAARNRDANPEQPYKPQGSAGPRKRAADGSASESERHLRRPPEGPSPPSRHASLSSPLAGGSDVSALDHRSVDNASGSGLNRNRTPSTPLNPAGRPSPPPEIYRGLETPGAWILTAPSVPASSHGAPSSIQGDAHHDRPTAPAALRRDGARANVPSDTRRSATGHSAPPLHGAGSSLPASAPVSPVRTGGNVHVQPGAAAASSAARPHVAAPTPVSARERSPAAQTPVNATPVQAHVAAPVPQPATTNDTPAVHTATAQPNPLQPRLGGPPAPTSLYLCTICAPGSSPAFQYPVALDHVLNQHHQPLVNAFNDQALSELRELSGTTEKLFQCIRCGEPFGAGPNQMGTAIAHVADRHLSRIRNGMIVLANGYMKPVAVPGAQQQ